MVVNSARRLHDDKLWKRAIDHMVKTGEAKLPTYYPGFLIFPDRSLGISGYIDLAFWGTVIYVLLATVYCIAGALPTDPNLGTEDAGYRDPSAELYLLGAILLLIDAFICFWELYVEYKGGGTVSHIHSEVDVQDGHIVFSSELTSSYIVLKFWAEFCFLGGAIIYFIQALWTIDKSTDSRNCYNDEWCGTFWIGFWGSFTIRKKIYT